MKKVIESKTIWGLNKKIREEWEKYPDLEVLRKGPSRCGMTKQKFYYAVVSYD